MKNSNIDQLDVNYFRRCLPDNTIITFKAIEHEDNWELIVTCQGNNFENNVVFNQTYPTDSRELDIVWKCLFLSDESQLLKEGRLQEAIMENSL